MKSKKKKTRIKMSETQQTGMLEKEIVRLVEKVIHDNLVGLAADDVKIIVKEIMPDLDRMISDKIKAHFAELGEYLIQRFKQ